MTPFKIFLSLVLASTLFACENAPTKTNPAIPEPTNKVVLASEINWTPLNPARGDQSPQAGTLWGDRDEEVATGFLVKFVVGFSSPPHIHNVTYRGIVISGLIHNDDPSAEKMWMPTGSFWTQPAGEAHITAAKGSENMAFIEIGEGPYLVRPTEQAFDNGERPLNVDASNLVWVNQPGEQGAVKVANLWGSPQDNQLHGTLIKLPAGFIGKIHSKGSTFRAVVVQGQPQYQMPHAADLKTMEPGSYFSSEGESVHQISSAAGSESIIYVRTDGKFEVNKADTNGSLGLLEGGIYSANSIASAE